jgi:hypothetical protein
MKISFLLILVLPVLPPVLNAQSTNTSLVSAGWGLHSADGLSGTAVFAQVGFPTALRLRGSRISLVAYGARGSGDGSPFSCQQVQQIYCFGRQDHNWWLGLTLETRVPVTMIANSTVLYGSIAAPTVGVRRNRSEEHQGPTTLCIVDGQIISCPNNPPFESFTTSATSWGLGISSGLGIMSVARGVEWSIELRVHEIWEPGGGGGSSIAPLIIGVRF